MTSYVTPKKNSAFVCFVSLVSQADTDIMQSNPTLAAGDAKVSIDGGALNNLATLPDVHPASSKIVRVQLSADEMNGDNIIVVLSDAAGDEWMDCVLAIQTTAQQIDDLSTVTVAQVNAQVDTALSDYDPPTAAEMTDAFTALQGADGDTLETLSDQIDTIDLSGVADAVWVDATTRTLTSTAAETVDAVSGSDLTVTAAVSFDATITGLTIPATWTKIIFTAKSSKSLADTLSWAQIVKSNPADDDDGLLYLNAAAGTAAQGSLTVDQSAGTIAIHLSDDATAEFTRALNGGWDVKCLTDGGESQQLTLGDFAVQLTETKALT